jgi:hypothetical protein
VSSFRDTTPPRSGESHCPVAGDAILSNFVDSILSSSGNTVIHYALAFLKVEMVRCESILLRKLSSSFVVHLQDAGTALRNSGIALILSLTDWLRLQYSEYGRIIIYHVGSQKNLFLI